MERIGRYRIERELGRGGMGVVYLGHDPAIDRAVAVKTLRPGADVPPRVLEQYRERFVREAKAAGRLSHPGIVTVFDAGQDAETGMTYIAMEYVPGRSLEEVLHAQGKLPLARALATCKQVAQALAYAHEMGVVHRDIKPANIILTEAGQAKLADFGVARLEDSQLTQTGQILGSPQCMAPEQVAGGEVDGRADLFGLGAVLYQAVTGERPFHAQTLTTLFYQIMNADPVPPAVINPTLPSGLDALVMRLLAKRPEDRYARAEDVIADLDALTSGRTPSAAAADAERTVDSTRVSPTAAPATPPSAKTGRAPPMGRSLLIFLGVPVAALLLWFVGVPFSQWALGGAGQDAQATTPVTPTPMPTPTPAPTPTPMAKLVIDFEHHIEQGSYRLLRDGETVHEGVLHARKKGRKFLPGVKMAHQALWEEVEVAAGRAHFEVRVSSRKNDLEAVKSIDGTLAAGSTRVLEIRVQRVTKKLNLNWR